jgi:hypothetical protein
MKPENVVVESISHPKPASARPTTFFHQRDRYSRVLAPKRNKMTRACTRCAIALRRTISAATQQKMMGLKIGVR